MGRYNTNRVKDHELPALVFLMDQLLRKEFKNGFEKITGKQIQAFLNEADSVGSNTKSITIGPVKQMLELSKFDNRYRPAYTSIEFLLEIYVGKQMDFKEYATEYAQLISRHFDTLDYTILKVNPEKNELVEGYQPTQVLNLGTQTGIQINLDQGAVASLLKSIAFRFGDMLAETPGMSKLPQMMREYESERVFKRIYRTEEVRQTNSDNIVAKAIVFAKDFEFSDHIVDQDWMSEFFNISQDCSNETMQFLWAKILANEVDTPGSFSRRTLHAIKLLEAEEASIFTLLCNCLWETYPGETRSDKVLFKNSTNEGKYSDATWGFDGDLLQHLEDLGLVHTTYMILEKDTVIDIKYFENKHQLSTIQNAIEVEIVRLSSVGAEIYDVVRASPNEAYYLYTLEFMEKENILKK